MHDLTLLSHMYILLFYRHRELVTVLFLLSPSQRSTDSKMGQSESTDKSRSTQNTGMRAEYQTYHSLFSPDEQEELQNVFERICQSNKRQADGQSSATFTKEQFMVLYNLYGYRTTI